METGTPLSLDNPDVDRVVNQGTSEANCQPKHTLKKDALETRNKEEGEEVEVESKGNAKAEVVEKHEDRRGDREKKRRSKERASAKEREDERERREQEKRMSYIQMAKIGYQELVNAIIRPPRADYKMEALGPPAFTFCGRRFTRTDFALNTKRGLSLQCSHWEPVERTSVRIPCVIYMHGNSSARVEVIPQLSYLLSLGLAVFSFDFAGSGKSDGEYVSLGYYEREDLMCVIAHLRATNVVSTIALWGRSMGAATALMHGDRDPSIACMILDSPFADLTQLAEEMVEKGKEQGVNVPNFVVAFAIRMIRGSVKRQADFDIRFISPITHADKCFIPALFVAGEHDDFINKRHSEAIHNKYAGDKNLIVVEGDHNSPRPKFMFDSVSIFLQTCLQVPNSWGLKTHPSMNLMAPPWFFPGPSKQTTRRTNKLPNNAKAPYKNQEMGMTKERQREIQASLFRMLGQDDDMQKEQKPDKPVQRKKKGKPKNNNFIEDGQAQANPSFNHATTFPPSTDELKEARVRDADGFNEEDAREEMRASPPSSMEVNSFSTADSTSPNFDA